MPGLESIPVVSPKVRAKTVPADNALVFDVVDVRDFIRSGSI